VNGLNLYFEAHGTGRPMILLHGGFGSGEMFAPILPTLVERHRVIAVDLQGHGRTADIDRPLDTRLMADDIAALIDHIGLRSRSSWATRSAAEWPFLPRRSTRRRSAGSS
jgi:pimeloyl-ACP methyl ester carboxylesterase